MRYYQKGATFERELVRKFWENGWTAIRAAGSGSNYPVPDVIAIKDRDIVAVECKATKKEKLNLKKDTLTLKKFADVSKAKAYIGIKFNREKPRFYPIDKICSKKSYTISLRDGYIGFDTLIKRQERL